VVLIRGFYERSAAPLPSSEPKAQPRPARATLDICWSG